MDIIIREKYKPLQLQIKNRNTSIFFYGRTNSGKTFTFNEVLNEILGDELENVLSMKITEIYKNTPSTLVDEVKVEDVQEIHSHLKNSRKISKTSQNDFSSRSIVILILKFINGKKIRLIDLMGSERSNDDVGNINNKNLTSLYRCISALKDKKKHIPYRDCALTTLLQECINDSKVSFIGCVDVSDEKETNKTLEFLNMTKSIVLPEIPLIQAPKETQKDDYLSDLLEIHKMLEKLITL